MTSTASNAASPPPPPYTPTARPTRPTPNITVLLLGSPGVGKSTFLSAIPHVRDGKLQTTNLPPPSYPSIPSTVPNPSSFSVSLFNRPYNIVIHRSESTLFIDPLPHKIDFVIFCYAIDSRESLYNCQFYWRRQFIDRYERELGLSVPVMLLGLKRDLRTSETRMVDGIAQVAQMGGREVAVAEGSGGQMEQKEELVCVMPHEGVKAATEMRCDRYAECSAVTGDLLFEALEDITRTAALTTTSKGGFSEGQCALM